MNVRSGHMAQTALVDDDEDFRSGVRALDRIERETAERGTLRVMLTITKWENATPGVLAWEFESISAAHKAARTFRNALAWAIFPADYETFEAAKRAGDVILTSDETL
jgi:hypothetical protein